MEAQFEHHTDQVVNAGVLIQVDQSDHVFIEKMPVVLFWRTWAPLYLLPDPAQHHLRITRSGGLEQSIFERFSIGPEEEEDVAVYGYFVVEELRQGVHDVALCRILEDELKQLLRKG